MEKQKGTAVLEKQKGTARMDAAVMEKPNRTAGKSAATLEKPMAAAVTEKPKAAAVTETPKAAAGLEKQTASILGVGIDLTLKLDLIKGLVSTLDDALKQTGSKLTDAMSGIYEKINELGPKKMKSEAEKGGFEDQYHQLVSKLQEVAGRGEEEARKVLHQMGETTEQAGHKIKEVSKKEAPQKGAKHTK